MPRQGPVHVEVEGLDALRAALRKAGPEATKKLKEANKATATHVVQNAEQRARQLGGVAAKVVSLGALFAANTARASQVNLRDRLVSAGGKGATMGAEFGSNRYAQFRPASDGYFLYATIRAERDNIESIYGKAIDRLLDEAGD